MSLQWCLVQACFTFLCTGHALALCKEGITGPLMAHIVPVSVNTIAGSYTDVWVSGHLAKHLNASYIDIDERGNTTSSVLYRNGQGFTATGKLWENEDGILRFKVDDFHSTGLIFPVFLTKNVLGYYHCYPNVTGPGVSVITVRMSSLLQPAVLNDVLEAKLAFRHLQELGISINDGVEFDDV